MKTSKTDRVCLFLFFGFLSIAVVSPAVAIEYLGQVCFEIAEGDVVVAGLTHIGDEHFQINGRVIRPSGDIEPLQGSADIVGTKIYMVINYNGEEGTEFFGGTARTVIDLVSMTGTHEQLEVYRDSTLHSQHQAVPWHELKQTYTQSSMAFITCPNP